MKNSQFHFLFNRESNFKLSNWIKASIRSIFLLNENKTGVWTNDSISIDERAYNGSLIANEIYCNPLLLDWNHFYFLSRCVHCRHAYNFSSSQLTMVAYDTIKLHSSILNSDAYTHTANGIPATVVVCYIDDLILCQTRSD